MALVLVILFLLVAGVSRVALQYRLTGDHGLRLATNSSSGVAKLSSALIVIAFIGIIVISALSTLETVELKFQFGTYGVVFGTIFCFSGMILTSISQVQMGKQWRIGVDVNEKTELVTHGIYSKIRNPIYTGVMIFGLGLVILVPHLSMLAFAAVGYFAIELHVRKVEEPYLKKLHGKSFANYVNTVGRYIPKIN